ncbi:MAG: N-acetylglucosamine-6-phosphate deacetylase, partial [Vicinamibacterales bacterium]
TLWKSHPSPSCGKPHAFSPADIGILTLAPEVPGGMDLIRDAVAAGIRVSLGHSGATFDQGIEAIHAGARHATHLFNRMSPMSHRDPGLVGAVLASEDIAAEIIGDRVHVHPAVVRVAIAAKGHSRMMAITDGTAGSGLPAGACARLGGRIITVGTNRDSVRLADGTLAGSVATMDEVFANLVTRAGQSLVEAATLCATTPAREMGLTGQGVIASGSLADLTVLTSGLRVVQTWVGGRTSGPRQP